MQQEQGRGRPVAERAVRRSRKVAGRLYRGARRLGYRTRRAIDLGPTPLQQHLLDLTPGTVYSEGAVRHVIDRTMPRDVTDANLATIASVLESAEVPYVWLRQLTSLRHVVAVEDVHRASVIEALRETGADLPLYVEPIVGRRLGSRREAARLDLPSETDAPDILRCGELYTDPDRDFGYGLGHGCDIEFWTREHRSPRDHVVFPRDHVTGRDLPIDLMEPEPVTVGGRVYPQARVMARTLLEDVVFDIDVVYTWVDGDDLAWLNRMSAAKAAAAGVPFHPMASHDARYRTRDEIRYSLRSLEMYAPWVRKIFLVTDDQRPEWLVEDDRLQVVSHRDIFADPSVLPVFNSSAIISQLHHIPGLAEHYLYLNDDVFFGRPVGPQTFFTAAGQARIFPSRNARPFGDPDREDEPHFNLTRNMRRLIDEEFGRTTTKAVKHTPHAQRRSVQERLEARFADAYRATAGAKFRSHEDIAADQLFHYYGQLSGDAIASVIRYDYVNISNVAYNRNLVNLLRLRDRDVFCLNDAPSDEYDPIEDETVDRFLADYFPVPSRFERVPDTTPQAPASLEPFSNGLGSGK